ADRPVREQLPVAIDVHGMARGTDFGDQRRADRERLGEVVTPVDARGRLDPVQVTYEAHARVRRPVAARTEVQAKPPDPALAVPVPGADNPFRGPDLQRALHRLPVGDR